MPPIQNSYIIRETLISVVINAVISAAFAYLVFGGRTKAELWGLDGVALDFVPQTFMIALMSSLIPSAIARRKARAGGAGADAPLSSTGKFLFRCLVIAMVATLALGTIGAGLAVALFNMPIEFQTLLIAKVIYGASVAALITPLALRMTLNEWSVRQ